MSDEALLRNFLSIHPFLELYKDEQDIKRVRCKITGHELPARLSDLESYTKGKKYQRLTKDTPREISGFEEYKEFLVPSSKNSKQLYCILTKKSITNSPFHIQKHVTGKRFTRALAKDREEQAKVIANEDKSDENMWVPSDLDSQSEIKEDENGTEMEEDPGNSDGESSSEGRKEQAKLTANGEKSDEGMSVPSDLESESQVKKYGGNTKMEEDLGKCGGELLSEEEEDTRKRKHRRGTKRELEAKKKVVKKSNKKLKAGVGRNAGMVKRSKKRKTNTS
ncbi:surfeit locus protein 2-like [Acropora muricata]|uniref:surfeit locus protein 2-like n=1 Tax=Acropora muricata TaxID=159855 RepID=UPI0034E437BD